MSTRTTAEIEQDIERTRAEMAATVDALGAKVDPRRHRGALAAVAGAAVLLLVAGVLWKRRH